MAHFRAAPKAGDSCGKQFTFLKCSFRVQSWEVVSILQGSRLDRGVPSWASNLRKLLNGSHPLLEVRCCMACAHWVLLLYRPMEWACLPGTCEHLVRQASLCSYRHQMRLACWGAGKVFNLSKAKWWVRLHSFPPPLPSLLATI